MVLKKQKAEITKDRLGCSDRIGGNPGSLKMPYTQSKKISRNETEYTISASPESGKGLTYTKEIYS